MESKPLDLEKPLESKPLDLEKPLESKPLDLEKTLESKPLDLEKLESKPLDLEKPTYQFSLAYLLVEYNHVAAFPQFVQFLRYWQVSDTTSI